MDKTAAAVHARYMLSAIAEASRLRASVRRTLRGWEIIASSRTTNERWRIQATDLHEAVCTLAEQVGFDLDA